MRSQNYEWKIWQVDRKDHKRYTAWKSVPLTIAPTLLLLNDTLFLCVWIVLFFAIETYCTSSPTYLILDCKFILSYHINTTETPPDVGGWLGQSNNYASNSKETHYKTLRRTENRREKERRADHFHFTFSAFLTPSFLIKRWDSHVGRVSPSVYMRAQDSNNGNVNEFSGLRRQTDSQGNEGQRHQVRGVFLPQKPTCLFEGKT